MCISFSSLSVVQVVRARNGTGGCQVQFVDFNIFNEKRKRLEMTTASREVKSEDIAMNTSCHSRPQCTCKAY